MPTPRSLEELKNIQPDNTDYSYNLAFIVNGTVEYVIGAAELFARVLLDSDKIVVIEEGQFSVGDSYISE